MATDDKATLVPAVIAVGPVIAGTLIDNGTIDSVVLLVADGLPLTVAMMMTLLSSGIVPGAVNMAAPVSVVWAGEILPHAPLVRPPVTGLPLQSKVQFTPELPGSFETASVNFAVCPIGTDVSCPVTMPLGSVTEIAPACGFEPLLPQPASVNSRQPKPREPTKPAEIRSRLFFENVCSIYLLTPISLHRWRWSSAWQNEVVEDAPAPLASTRQGLRQSQARGAGRYHRPRVLCSGSGCAPPLPPAFRC